MPEEPAGSPTLRGTAMSLDAAARVEMKRSVDNWKRVGPILEAERWTNLAEMSDEEAQRASQRVLELWQPGWHGDDGEEILLHQRVFARART